MTTRDGRFLAAVKEAYHSLLAERSAEIGPGCDDPHPPGEPPGSRWSDGRRRSLLGIFGLALVVTAALWIFVFGRPIHRPKVWPDGTTAQCRDGSFSRSTSDSGTCSFHDGVMYWRHVSETASR